ncbi:hypothetical protein ACFFUT_01085 [Pseudohalocynthiibacter aestuariivivens]|jgi:hypothetical protein|uniref:Uncharacterized protein n=1 Tax=Pseudohalocynthiibacter aestuariivivens TaxID=1591409 RepID=A0ABV5JA99_9RHOB|nr:MULTISPECIES: hypothetical protein [Pseudohalocynthiibacter]MBS9716064.1 hypothetical protein [Pseudohalocynthiibacter aestuariivivens]MCK0102379.1 hypothetical protein [Pseudohalocynthiibacter sp. F2068]
MEINVSGADIRAALDLLRFAASRSVAIQDSSNQGDTQQAEVLLTALIDQLADAERVVARADEGLERLMIAARS